MTLLLAALFACALPDHEETAKEITDTASDVGEEDSCDGITPKVTDITVDELKSMMEDKDFLLINVHIPYAGEIPETDANIAYTDTEGIEAFMDNNPAVRAVLYCKTGPMSATAASKLVDKGYCNIMDLPEAMKGWENAGYDIEEN